MSDNFPKHWLTLAEEASNEKNSARLRHLVAELCRAIDAEHETKVRSSPVSSPKH
jgi:hypothetical protein